MVLGIKEGLVECATVCVKSVFILKNKYRTSAVDSFLNPGVFIVIAKVS